MSISSRVSAATLTSRRPTVLVVDDSAFMRRVISDLIAESGDFEVVGTARDGVHALEQVHALNPDIVTLDIEMPGQDGLDALREIMRTAPRAVIMLSAGAAADGMDATLRALECGAVEFVHKLRNEEKYDNLETLTRQIGVDVAQARNYFAATHP